VTRRRGRRCKKLLDDLKDRREYSHLKEEALDRTMWRNRFGGGFGPVIRENTELMKKYIYIYELSAVGTETAYGLDVQGIKSRWGRNFPNLSRTDLKSTQHPVKWVPDLYQG